MFVPHWVQNLEEKRGKCCKLNEFCLQHTYIYIPCWVTKCSKWPICWEKNEKSDIQYITVMLMLLANVIFFRAKPCRKTLQLSQMHYMNIAVLGKCTIYIFIMSCKHANNQFTPHFYHIQIQATLLLWIFVTGNIMYHPMNLYNLQIVV